MPNRVQIKLASETWGVDEYTFDINPVEFAGDDEQEVAQKRTVDGKSTEQYGLHDGRIRTMTWNNLPNKEPYMTLISTLRTYVRAGVCSLRLRDLTGSNNQSVSSYIKVTDFRFII